MPRQPGATLWPSRSLTRVGADAERGFRIHGTAWLSVSLETKTARPREEDGRIVRLVA